jgi:hypothetical protein
MCMFVCVCVNVHACMNVYVNVCVYVCGVCRTFGENLLGFRKQRFTCPAARGSTLLAAAHVVRKVQIDGTSAECVLCRATHGNPTCLALKFQCSSDLFPFISLSGRSSYSLDFLVRSSYSLDFLVRFSYSLDFLVRSSYSLHFLVRFFPELRVWAFQSASHNLTSFCFDDELRIGWAGWTIELEPVLRNRTCA